MKSPYYCNFLKALPITAVFVVVVTLTEGASAQNAEEGRAELEKITRLEAKMLITQSLQDAKKLVAAGDIQRAKARYQDVLAKTNETGPNAELNRAAKQQLAGLIALQANQALSEGDKFKARSLAEEALAVDPSNETLKKQVAQLRSVAQTTSEKYPNNIAANEDLKERIDQIRELLFRGDAYTNTGQYSRAEGAFNEILRIDPYNTVAMDRLKKITTYRNNAAKLRREADREESMLNITKSWNMKPKLPTNQRPLLVADDVEQTNVTKIYDKLENIRIPELNFTDVDIAEAVNYLQAQSKALDPTGEGINFVLKAEPTVVGGTEEGEAPVTQPLNTLTLDVRDMPLIKILDFINQLTNLKFKVEEYAVYIFPPNETSDVKVVRSFSVPPTFFSNVVTSTGAQTAIGADEVKIVGADVKKQLEDKGVTFTSGTSAAYLPKTAKLVVRNTLEQISLIEQLVSKESGETTQVLIESKFIEFSDDSLKDFSSNLRISADSNIPSAFYNAVGTAIPFVPPIDADVDDLNGTGVADGFPDYGNSGNALFSKARVGMGTNLRNSRDLSTSTIDGLLQLGGNRNAAELGFTGILGSTGFRYLLSAIDSTIGSDLMTAPKVTLVNGQTSQIRVVREFYYPTEYEVPEIVVNNGGGNNNNNGGGGVPLAIPSTPTDFEKRDVGVLLEVKANATPDRRIDLELKPEVIEFEGFIDYGADINLSTTVTVSQTTVGNLIPALNGTTTASTNTTNLLARANNLRPVFSTRSVETKLQVIDGQTVVMAGFIRNDEEEFNDKVPFLGDLPLVGRAFRSKTSKSIKKNLVLFITARMVNPDGTPKFLTEEEAAAIGMSNAN